MAMYIEANVPGRDAATLDIQQIWGDINQSPDRPQQERNSLYNMKWWLEKRYPYLNFVYRETNDLNLARQWIVEFIDNGFPILASVSHTRTKGHIVCIIGYENYDPTVSTTDFHVFVHDPYGRLDPSLFSNAYGNRGRYDWGMCLKSGGETGPGEGVPLSIDAISRHRPDDSNFGTFRLISVVPNRCG